MFAIAGLPFRYVEIALSLWGKKCPFCGREMKFVLDAVFDNQDRDRKRLGV